MMKKMIGTATAAVVPSATVSFALSSVTVVSNTRLVACTVFTNTLYEILQLSG